MRLGAAVLFCWASWLAVAHAADGLGPIAEQPEPPATVQLATPDSSGPEAPPSPQSADHTPPPPDPVDADPNQGRSAPESEPPPSSESTGPAGIDPAIGQATPPEPPAEDPAPDTSPPAVQGVPTDDGATGATAGEDVAIPQDGGAAPSAHSAADERPEAGLEGEEGVPGAPTSVVFGEDAVPAEGAFELEPDGAGPQAPTLEAGQDVRIDGTAPAPPDINSGRSDLGGAETPPAPRVLLGPSTQSRSVGTGTDEPSAVSGEANSRPRQAIPNPTLRTTEVGDSAHESHANPGAAASGHSAGVLGAAGPIPPAPRTLGVIGQVGEGKGKGARAKSAAGDRWPDPPVVRRPGDSVPLISVVPGALGTVGLAGFRFHSSTTRSVGRVGSRGEGRTAGGASGHSPPTAAAISTAVGDPQGAAPVAADTARPAMERVVATQQPTTIERPAARSMSSVPSGGLQIVASLLLGDAGPAGQLLLPLSYPAAPGRSVVTPRPPNPASRVTTDSGGSARLGFPLAVRRPG